MIKIILKTEDPKIIQQRLLNRDGEIWDIKIIQNFQNKKESQDYNFSNINEIPIFHYNNENCFDDVVKFIKA